VPLLERGVSGVRPETTHQTPRILTEQHFDLMTLGCEAKEIVQYLHVRHFRQLCGKHTRKSTTYKVEHNFSQHLSNIFLNHSFSISIVFSVTHFYSLLIFLHYLFLVPIHLIKSKPRLKKFSKSKLQHSYKPCVLHQLSASSAPCTQHPLFPTFQPCNQHLFFAASAASSPLPSRRHPNLSLNSTTLSLVPTLKP